MNISCPSLPMAVLACSVLAMTATTSHAQEAAASSSRIEQRQQQLGEQARQIESLRQAVTDQEARHRELQRSLGQEPRTLAGPAGASSPSPTQPATDTASDTSQRAVRVGSAPPQERQPPAVAPLFDQPAFLPPKANSYSSLRFSTSIHQATGWPWWATPSFQRC